MTAAAEWRVDELIAAIAVDVPDFPEPGGLFRDLTPVFADAGAFRRVVDALTGTGSRAPAFPELTERERQVLELLAAGLATGRITQRLALSDKTVRNHVSAVVTKLQVPDRSAAVARARAAGLGR